MQKKFLIFLFLITYTISLSFAEPIKQRLWKIEKKGQAVSYLIGTIHTNYPDYVLDKNLQKIMRESQLLLTEVKMQANENEKADPLLLQAFSMMINPHSEHQLVKDLGLVRSQKVAAFYRNNPVLKDSAPWMNRQYGWTVFMNLSSAVPDALSINQGIDFQLNNLAYQHNIQRMGLEGLPESLQVFQNIPLAKIHQMIDLLLEHQQENNQDVIKMVQLYNQGKIAELIQWSLDEKQALKYLAEKDKPFWRQWFYHDLLTNRNQQWLPIIEQQLSQQKTLIAVGLLHLTGKNGLVALLREKGYRLTPIE